MFICDSTFFGSRKLPAKPVVMTCAKLRFVGDIKREKDKLGASTSHASDEQKIQMILSMRVKGRGTAAKNKLQMIETLVGAVEGLEQN